MVIDDDMNLSYLAFMCTEHKLAMDNKLCLTQIILLPCCNGTLFLCVLYLTIRRNSPKKRKEYRKFIIRIEGTTMLIFNYLGIYFSQYLNQPFSLLNLTPKKKKLKTILLKAFPVTWKCQPSAVLKLDQYTANPSSSRAESSNSTHKTGRSNPQCESKRKIPQQ